MNPLTVSELVAGIRRVIEGVPEWQKVWVVGELNGVKHHSSGHWYFTLKDERAQIRAVMFRRDAANLNQPLRDGMAVMALGRIGVFERDGQTQFYVSYIRDMGQGSSDRALAQLKERLYQEGLFSRPKRPLPLIPRSVAVVTSVSGAARHDIETVIHRRFPGMPILLFPVTVQGPEAVPSIVAALQQVPASGADVVIVGRGGGAKDDLSAFNDEAVVRALWQSPIPSISAVGHEIDTTLVDLVADVRAATPSAAAELAVPEKAQLVLWQEQLQVRSHSALVRRLEWERQRLSGWQDHGVLAHPAQLFGDYQHRLDRLDERLERGFDRVLTGERHRFETLTRGIDLLNPHLPLKRGYTYVTDATDHLVERNEVKWGERYLIHWHDGSLFMTPLEVPGDERRGHE